MRKRNLIVGATAFFVISLAVYAATFSVVYTNAALLRANNNVYRLRIADTVAEQQRGLSGVQQMSNSKGMLFVLDKPQVECFWMKNMHFPLDIIWLNEDKQVVYTEESVSPDSYPLAYCPPSEAKYVIELAAGQVEKANITLDQKLNF